MSEIKIDISPIADRVFRKYSGLPRGILRKVLDRVMPDLGAGSVAAIKREGFSGRPALISRTGESKDSFFYEVSGTTISIKSNQEQKVFTHVTGKTIVPVTAKSLAIPLSGNPNVVSNGIKLYPSPLSTSTFKVVKPSPGRAFLAFRESGEFSHTLRRSVYIPPRLNLIKIVTKYIKERGVKLIQRELQREVDNG